MSDKKLNLNSLPPQQLVELQQDLQTELEHFQSSAKALASAKRTFQDCIDNVTQIAHAGDDEQILIPLSASLYVPGKVKENKKFLVDVGTGYFVEKDEEASKLFYQGRINKLNTNSEQINKIISERYETLQSVQAALQQRVQLQQLLMLKEKATPQIGTK